MDGDWGAAVIRLIFKPMSMRRATKVWQAWEPYSAHPPSSPMGPIQVQEATIKVLIAHYKWGPTALEAVKDIKDCAEASLTTAAFAENTNITLEESLFWEVFRLPGIWHQGRARVGRGFPGSWGGKVRYARKVGKRLDGCVATTPSPGNCPGGGRARTNGGEWGRFQSSVSLYVGMDGVWMFVPRMGGGIVS